jgi:hypothetical protein
MAASSPVLALPWYARGDYRALLELFTDPDKLPATYDAWLKHAERTESQLQKGGFGVARIWIRPVAFTAWCKERKVSPDQRARLTFANEAARDTRAARSEQATKANATPRAVIAEIQRAGHSTLAPIAQELEARGVRTPAGRDRWDAKQVSRLLAA